MTTAVQPLPDEALARLRDLLATAAGLVFEDSRRASLSAAVAERQRLTGMRDVAAYLDLACDPAGPERQSLLDEVTIQETHFFRNPPQMRALRTEVLPELVRAARGRGRRLRIWSAGCSTGEEPYTVAMMLRELLPDLTGWDVRVLATDLSQTALRTARAGTYGERAVQLASPATRGRFLLPTEAGRYEVRREVRELVRFTHHNLVLDPVPRESFDLILCRNVTIYFGRETTRALVRRLHGCLRDGGYLLLGHAETLWQVNDDFRLVAVGGDSPSYVYRRPAPSSPMGQADRRTTFRPPAPRPPPPGSMPPGTESLGSCPADAVRAVLAEGRHEQAARLARRAAAAEPMRPELHYLLGRALVELGRDAEALPALRRATYLEPAAGLAHFLLAGALARCGDARAAAREYQAAASTLGLDLDEAGAPELGGRSARELAELCRQLEGQLSGSADPGNPDVGGTT